MNTDFIKWMVGYAEDYILIADKIYYEGCYFDNPLKLWDQKLHRYNLLQKAIEGINLEMGIYGIDITKDCIEVWGNGLSKKIVLIKGKLHEYTFDEAKEQALKYIWEQETK